MSRARQAQSIPSQIPIKGMSSQFSIAKMPPDYAIEIVDMEIDNGAMRTIKGIKYIMDAPNDYAGAITQHPTDSESIVILDPYPSGTVQVEAVPYNVFTDTVGTAVTDSRNTSAILPVVQSLNFASKAFFFFRSSTGVNSDPVVYDGTSLNPVAFTGPTLESVVVGFSFRERMYVFEQEDSSVWYGSVGGVAGAFTEFSLANITKGGGFVVCGFDFTLSSGLDSQSLWAVVMSTGEVIVYSGTHPGAADWILVSRSRIAAPVGYQSIVEVNGDVLVITKGGIVSMRELFTNARGNVEAATVTAPIADFWLAYMKMLKQSSTSIKLLDGQHSLIKAAYHQIENKLVVFLPQALSSSTEDGSTGWTEQAHTVKGSTILVYDFNNGAWTIEANPVPLNNPATTGISAISAYYHENSERMFFGSSSTASGDQSVWQLWGSDNGRHETKSDGTKQTITPKIISAPLAIPGNKKVNGLRVVHSGDDDRKEDVKVNLFAELGAKSSQPTQHTNLTTGASRDVYSSGIEGEFVQWKLELDSNTDDTATATDYELAAVNVIVEPGGVVG